MEHGRLAAFRFKDGLKSIHCRTVSSLASIPGLFFGHSAGKVGPNPPFTGGQRESSTLPKVTLLLCCQRAHAGSVRAMPHPFQARAGASRR